ncbi:MAG: hypothetical protein ABUL77_03445 [Bacteroidota bacterium]
MSGAEPAPATQRTFAPLQVPRPPPPPAAGQQVCPAPPQATHVVVVPPAPPAPPPPAPPAPVVVVVQTPPGWQVLPGQQAPPAAPHIMQVFGVPAPGGLAQPRLALQVSPVQQTWLFAPQAAQTPPWQEKLLAHAAPVVQHGSPECPQALHMPPEQTPPG